MSLPLATLRRHETRVLLNDGFTWANGGTDEPARQMTRIEFRAPHDAVLYLRFWKCDAKAMADLRNALYRHVWMPTSRFSDDEVIDVLAGHLVRGQLVAAAERPNFGQSAGVAIPGPAGQPAEEPAAPLPTASLAEPPPVPLLPKLEEVQIEGAMVLPEVLQTLEQLELTLGQIEIATVSLEPAPSGIPLIDAALGEASGSITATIDGV